jgi:putative nucleotidyltransferase with HDIG domain
VLVVEDEDIVRELLVHVLGRGGYQVSSAMNGRDALEILEDTAIDLILTDLRMPVMGGLALARDVRAHYPDVDIIVLTAYGTIDSAVEALKLGALDYLAKPFDINELLDRVALSFQQRQERITARQAPTMPLLELNRIISRSADLETTLDEILALVKGVFAAEQVHMELLNGWRRDDLAAPERQPGIVQGHLPKVSAAEIRALAQEANPWRFDAPGHAVGRERPTQGHGIVVPMVSSAEVIGILKVARAAQAPRYTETDAQLLHLFGAQMALAVLHGDAQRQLHKTFSDLQELSLSAAEALAEALGTFDEYTRGHSQRVSRQARRLAQRMGLSEHWCDLIEIAGLLHDIGKLGVGETTLRKNGQLTEAEHDRIKLHPVQGAHILSGLDALAEIVPIVRHHHERYDGGGYPDGLRGEQIPFGARLLAVVDAYDSMTTDRPYRMALAEQETRRRLRQGAGTQFDPAVVDAWLLATEEGPCSAVEELAWETHA